LTHRARALAVATLLAFGATQASAKCEPVEEGELLRNNHQYDDAMNAFERALHSTSADCLAERASVLAVLAELQSFQGDRNAAMKSLTESMRLAPAEGLDRRQQRYAALLVNEGRPAEAVQILEAQLKTPERNSSSDIAERSAILRNLARAYLAAGDGPGAEDAFGRAASILERSGHYAFAGDVRLEWATHLETVGRIDRARDVFEEAARAADSNPRQASLSCLAAYVEFLRIHGPATEAPRAEAILQRAKSQAPQLDETPETR
jgi:tetratricopeptide (TPR) repeat protein